MRWLRLYLRSRYVPVASATAVAAVVLAWLLWAAFAESVTVDIRLVSLTVMLAVVAFAPTLGGPDDGWERTAAIRWPVRRAGHLLAVGAVVVGLLLLTTGSDARFTPSILVLRDTAGLLGLTALGAALWGAARSWIVPLIWSLVAAVPWHGADPGPVIQAVTWPVQPAGSTAATVCASVLGISGFAAYTAFGCPRWAAAEPVADH